MGIRATLARRSARNFARRLVTLGFSYTSRFRISFLSPDRSTNLRKRRTASWIDSRSLNIILTMCSANRTLEVPL